MYSVLSGKPKSTQTETQALLKLNDQCDRLMKQVETNIERAETHRAEARQTSYRESESQTSKEDRNAVRASPNSAGGCFSHRNEDGVRGEWERERLGGGGGTGRGGNATGSGSGTNSASESTRQMFGVGQKSTEPTDARRAYPAGAFRDDFGTDFVATRGFGEDGNGNGEDEYDGDDADETDNGDKHGTAEIDDERAADRKVSVMRQKLLAMNMQLNARFSSDNLKDTLVKTRGNVDGAIDALLESKRGTDEEEDERERRKKRERTTTDAENEVIVLN